MKKSNTTPTHTKIENSQSPTFKLGPWLVNQSTNTITRDGDGECLTIEPKMMNVLVYLCQNAELTVSAEQLLIACWAGTFYGDAPVQKCIAGLRKKLGCNSRHPIYIETIHRRGYKIIAEVTFYQDQHSLVTVEDRHRWTHGSPYLGLNTFQQEHASIFFGRTKATADVIQGLKHCVEHHFHFLLILGKSGSGKSSLIRAGVLPYLQQQDGFSNIKIDNHQIISPSQSKYISPTTILIDALRTLELIKPDVDLTTLATKIEKAPELLQDALILENTGESKACISNTNKNLLDKGNASVKSYQLLVLDQFEQFLLDDNLNELEKSNLVTCINQLAYCKNLLVIAMLRNDYYANCLDVKGFLELKDHGQQYDLQTPSPFEISKMIRTPAAYAGVTFEVDKNTGEQLDELLLESAIKNPNALPLLEYTLDQLYQQRDKNNVMLLSVYYSMGGIEGAIAQQAEKTFNNMPAKVQKCWDKIMHTLVKIDTNNLHAVTARKVPLSIFTCPDQQHFIHTFLSAKLFVSILRSPRGEHRLSYSGDNINQITSRNSIELQFITIAHEALLHHWKKVNKWVDENRTAIQKREQLASDCQHWIDNNKNKDALLNSKKKLRDGLWLTTRTAIRLNNEELAFIHQSKRQHNRIKHIKNTVLFLMCCFVFTIVLQSKQVSHERDIAIQQSGRAEAISDFLTEMFSGARPHQAKGKDILVKDILALASEKLNQTNTHNLSEQPGVEASIQNIIGGIYLDLGLIAPGEQHLLRALTLYKNLSDNHSKEYLALIDNLITLYAMKFDNKKEYPLINEAIALSNQLYGEGHRRTIKYKNNLGIYYNNMGLLDKAENIFVEVYQKRLQLFGENDKQTVESIEYLATLYYWLGQYEKAEKFYKRCLKLNRILLEKNHPDTLVCLARLGSLYETMGKYNEAAPILIEHIEQATIILGSQHPKVLRSMHNLADTYRGLEKFDESEVLFRKTLQSRRKLLGENHIETLQTQMKLARLLRLINQYDEALILVRDTAEKQKALLGEEHPTTLIAMQELANLYQHQNKLAKALEIYNHVLTTRIKVLGEAHPDLSKTLLGLITTYLLNNNTADAEKYFKQLTKLAEKKPERFQSDVMTAKTLLTNYYAQHHQTEI